MTRLKTFLLLLALPILTFCQNNWQKVGSAGFDWPVRYLYVDSANNLLYTSGNFDYVDGLNVNQIAKWNGLNWDSLSHGEIAGGIVYAMFNYSGFLYASGNFSSDWNYLLGRWNGLNWDTSGIQLYGATFTFKEHNGELYLGGTFGLAGWMPATYLAKYDGTTWTSFNNLNWTGYGVLALEFYNGELYCGGNFWDTANGISRLAKWNGTNFVSVGGGIVGAFAYVSDMAIYQNELIIAGGFHSADGNVGNAIVKWDGTNLTPLGNGIGTIYTINDIEVYGGYLYAVGDFTDIDGVPANHIARWDGTSWSAIGPEQFDNNISAIAFYQNQMYVGGGFRTIDSDTVNFIARYTGPLSVKEETENISVHIFPNPSASEITIQLPEALGKDAELNLLDVLGRTVLSKKLEAGKTIFRINIHSLLDAVYIAQIVRKDKMYSAKIMKYD